MLKQALLAIGSREEKELDTPDSAVNSFISGISDTSFKSIRHASVSVIIRFNSKTGLAARADSSASSPPSLKAFLDQDFIDEDSAEILFIKRTVRDTDRWSGHVGLPGGRRDPEDSSDLVTAKRETLEEVGIDLDRHGIYVGPLNQRYATTHWGGEIIMVLCSYVFLINTPDPIPLSIQESEVAFAFWCPISELNNPANACRYNKDISGIATNYLSLPVRLMLRVCLPYVSFPGLHIADRFAYTSVVTDPSRPPLIMWGLTHSIIYDFLDILDPSTVLLRPRLPLPGHLATRFVLRMLNKLGFYNQVLTEIECRAPQTACWKANSQGRLSGYVKDRYFRQFQLSVILDFVLRLSTAGFLASKLWLTLMSSRRFFTQSR
ncbi:NUDIX hydrolase domain-like protein [Dipodascopsis uninucleata]